MIPGIDIVSTERIRKALARFGVSFERRILTPGERELYRMRRDPVQFLAGRFAAKEAIYKAAGIADLTWQRVAILSEDRHPTVWIDGKRREDVRVSISHEKQFAVAVAVRVTGSGDPQEGC